MNTSGNFVRLNGEEVGPFTLSQLKSMWEAGRLTSETLYWFEGLSDWFRIGEALEEAVEADRAKERARLQEAQRSNIQPIASKENFIEGPSDRRDRVIVSGLDIPFSNLFSFMVLLLVAAVFAALIVAFAFGGIGFIVMASLGLIDR